MPNAIALFFQYLAANPTVVESVIAEVPAVVEDIQKIVDFVKALQAKQQA